MKYHYPKEELNKEEYLRQFEGNVDTAKKKMEVALEKALDIRKFEISLYWKRATYFWAFIAATFTSYFVVLKISTDSTGFTPELKQEISFLLLFLGLFLSVAWYFVNKGSKHWHENWEKHVDLLEDSIMGPLYKTTASNDNFWDRINPLTSYPYSVGKINQLISLSIVFLWLFLLISFTLDNFTFQWWPFLNSYFLISTFFAILFFVLFSSSRSTGSGEKEFAMRKREIRV